MRSFLAEPPGKWSTPTSKRVEFDIRKRQNDHDNLMAVAQHNVTTTFNAMAPTEKLPIRDRVKRLLIKGRVDDPQSTAGSAQDGLAKEVDKEKREKRHQERKAEVLARANKSSSERATAR